MVTYQSRVTPRVGSSSSSRETRRRRSRANETFLHSSSTPSDTIDNKDEQSQLTAIIRRNTELITSSAVNAGIPILHRVTVEEMLQLEKMTLIPNNTIRMIRSFFNSLRLCIFPSEHEKAIWKIKRLKKTEEQLLASLEESWTSHAGPFIRLLDSTITSLHVKRQRYHGGAFVGNDCIRLLKGANQLAAVLTPRQFTSSDGKQHTIGSNDQSSRVLGLLTRLRDLHQLYSAARPLCRHEVAALQRKAYEYGNWYPVNFPDQTITPKMHVMIYHMPELAQLYHTVGMFSEQAGESIHTVFNKLNRQYVYMGSDVKRLDASMQRCIRLHDPSVLEFVRSRSIKT
jgi:hypothetical protein